MKRLIAWNRPSWSVLAFVAVLRNHAKIVRANANRETPNSASADEFLLREEISDTDCRTA
jgi:hypothetical protein